MRDKSVTRFVRRSERAADLPTSITKHAIRKSLIVLDIARVNDRTVGDPIRDSPPPRKRLPVQHGGDIDADLDLAAPELENSSSTSVRTRDGVASGHMELCRLRKQRHRLIQLSAPEQFEQPPNELFVVHVSAPPAQYRRASRPDGERRRDHGRRSPQAERSGGSRRSDECECPEGGELGFPP